MKKDNPKYSLVKVTGDKIKITKLTGAEYEIITRVLEELVKQDNEKEIKFNLTKLKECN